MTAIFSSYGISQFHVNAADDLRPGLAGREFECFDPDGAESEFAAVHSFLQRLERKGLVARDRSSFVHVFSPAASQGEVLGQELKTLAERLGADSIAPLIMQLIDQKRLTRKEAADIRKLLDKYPK